MRSEPAATLSCTKLGCNGQGCAGQGKEGAQIKEGTRSGSPRAQSRQLRCRALSWAAMGKGAQVKEPDLEAHALRAGSHAAVHKSGLQWARCTDQERQRWKPMCSEPAATLSCTKLGCITRTCVRAHTYTHRHARMHTHRTIQQGEGLALMGLSEPDEER
eukprot:1142377-Pelagomonas_calceolata.AAC.9